LACLALALPVVLIFAVGQCFFTGGWAELPGQVGLSLGILFTGLGLSSVVSARYTVAVPLPGDSPFKKPPGNVGQTLAVQFAGMGILGLLVLPEVGLILAFGLWLIPMGWLVVRSGWLPLSLASVLSDPSNGLSSAGRRLWLVCCYCSRHASLRGATVSIGKPPSLGRGLSVTTRS